MSSKNTTFCSLMWKHVCVRTDYQLAPCCLYHGNLSVENSVDIDGKVSYNSESFKEIRKKMLAGERVGGCEQCYYDEEFTGESLRTTGNRQYPLSFKPAIEADLFEVEDLELFVGSICNLKCVTCSPNLSSTIYKEYKDLGWVSKDTSTLRPPERLSFFNNLKTIKHVKFVGGEPFLNKLHDKAVERLQDFDISELKLTYFTNATVLPTEKTLKLWSEVGTVHLHLSIDSLGEENDYLRANSKWDGVEKITTRYLELCQQMPNLRVQVNSAVSILNLLSIPKLENWWNNLREKYSGANTRGIYLMYVYDPEYLAPHNGPEALINKALQGLDQPHSEQYLKILKILKDKKNTDEVDPKRLLNFLKSLENVRGNSFRETFPEIEAFF